MDVQPELLVSYLKWDSCFFYKKIGLIKDALAFSEHVSLIYPFLQKEGYDLVYVFSQSLLSCSFCQQYGGQVVDRKITYECEVQDALYDVSHVIEYSGNPVLLFDLAYQSGHASRFKGDEHFSDDDFKRLYQAWVINSMSKDYADVLYIYKVDSTICGFITVKQEERGRAKIGLFATDENWRRRGVGKELFRAVLGYCQKKSINKLQVVTQEENSQAKAFYERQNMSLIESINIYHFWL